MCGTAGDPSREGEGKGKDAAMFLGETNGGRRGS